MTHEDYMGICIDLAHKAAKNGDVPVGALIVKDKVEPYCMQRW